MLLLVAFTGCRGATADPTPGPTVVRPSPEGDPRHFAMGFSTMPAEETVPSYISAFATAARYGELVMIDRAPPWEEFFPNRQPSDATNSTTRLEADLLRQYDGLSLIFAIDPTDPLVQRERVANLPASVSPGEGFANVDLRNAFVAYAGYVVRNYHPKYLVLGVEINMLRNRNPDQFQQFVSLYNETYDSIKASHPDVKIFPTFQLEDLLGSLGDVHAPQWEVLDAFRGRMDVLAFSSYPYLAGIRTAAELHEDYYSQIAQQGFDGEIMLLDAGYPSAPIAGERISGTEADQDAFLQRILSDAEAAGFSGLVWRAALDPQYANAGQLAVFKSIGLRQGDGTNKQAWNTWETWSLRPYER
jgi:hypothetical protein